MTLREYLEEEIKSYKRCALLLAKKDPETAGRWRDIAGHMEACLSYYDEKYKEKDNENICTGRNT